MSFEDLESSTSCKEIREFSERAVLFLSLSFSNIEPLQDINLG